MPRDFFGREIHPGQTLVCAALVDRSAVLKSGHVIAIGDDPRITVEIASEKRASAGYVVVKRKIILSFPDRCVVVPRNCSTSLPGSRSSQRHKTCTYLYAALGATRWMIPSPTAGSALGHLNRPSGRLKCLA
jgi:hypothetical protein